jgi:hypothetical protein
MSLKSSHLCSDVMEPGCSIGAVTGIRGERLGLDSRVRGRPTPSSLELKFLEHEADSRPSRI